MHPGGEQKQSHRISEAQVLAAIAHGPKTMDELAEHLHCTWQNARYWLQLLEQAGRVVVVNMRPPLRGSGRTAKVWGFKRTAKTARVGERISTPLGRTAMVTHEHDNGHLECEYLDEQGLPTNEQTIIPARLARRVGA